MPNPYPKPSLFRGAIERLARVPWPAVVAVLVAALVLFVFAEEAMARSGGSGGGMRFRGGGGGFSGGRSGGGFGGGGFHVYGCFYVPFELIIAVLVIMVVMSIIANMKKKAAEASRVYRVRFAVEMPGDKPWEELEALVRRATFASNDGLAGLCRDAAMYCRKRIDRITHAALAAEPKKLSPDEAEAKFLAFARDARGFFNREVLRVEAAGVTEKTREAATIDELHDEDGDFGINEYFLVTIIVALRGKGPELPLPIATHQDVDTALARLAGVSGDEVLACEVVWTPAAKSDILTSDNLLESFPDLGRLV
jgi:uncharacterized membrane protein